MFWSKCNKLLVNASGELINCNNCPCGYWAVFGFKWRWLDCDTMQPDPCSWNYSVQAKEVKDNKVYWDYGCIEISQNMGLCGTKKGKFNCWQDCWEWDQQGNCIDGEEYCDCIQVEVYNVSGCYDTYPAFQAAFFSGCGVAPDDTGNYPAIFQTSYGNVYMTSAASDCVENYWQKIFADKYLLNFNLEVQRMNQNWAQGCAGYVYETIYFDYCGDDNCNYYDDYNGGCPEGYQVCSDPMQGMNIGFNAYAHCENDSSLSYEGITHSENNDKGQCCDKVATVAELPQINAHITEKVNDKTVYFDNGSTNYNCTNSSNVCAQAEYESKCWDNVYGDFAGCRITFNWARLKLSRNDQTPAVAAGVKFLCKITHTRENIGYGKSEKIIETSEQEISINFDDVYQGLPLATNTNLLSIWDTPSCDENCWQSLQKDDTGQLKNWWRNSPHVNWWDDTLQPYPNDAWVDKYQVQIIGKEYIK